MAWTSGAAKKHRDRAPVSPYEECFWAHGSAAHLELLDEVPADETTGAADDGTLLPLGSGRGRGRNGKECEAVGEAWHFI